jgi:hypothetical protein
MVNVASEPPTSEQFRRLNIALLVAVERKDTTIEGLSDTVAAGGR